MIGFAATGKTTIGSLLADKLNIPFVDVDAQVEQTAGKTVKQIFQERGERYFRELENSELGKLTNKIAVIACGGGSVLCDEFPRLAATGKVVWLQASAETVRSRLTGGRPLFDGLTTAQLRDFVARRAALYDAFAEITLATDDVEPSRAAEELLKLLRR